MKFGQNLRRAEQIFRDIVGVDLRFVSYKKLKKLLKLSLQYYTEWLDMKHECLRSANPQTQEAETLYLETAEKFMGVLCQDILEISWQYGSQIKNCTPEQRIYFQAYAFLNTEAVRKICKKFDKHVPGEDILGNMMNRMRSQSFFADMQTLGPFEVSALRQLLAVEGFEEETFPFEDYRHTHAQPSYESGYVHSTRPSQDSNHWLNQMTTPKGQKGWDWQASDIYPNAKPNPETGRREKPRPVPQVLPPGPLVVKVVSDDEFSPETRADKGDPRGWSREVQSHYHQELRMQDLQMHDLQLPKSAMEKSDSLAKHYTSMSSPNGREPKNSSADELSQITNLPPIPQAPKKLVEKKASLPKRKSRVKYNRKNQPKKKAPRNSDSIDEGNLIVNYLPNDWTELELLSVFSPLGEILGARVIREKNTRKSKGFGFVKYASSTAAREAIRRLHGSVYGNKRLKVAFAKERRCRVQANLFVSRFPSDWTSHALKKLFEPYGTIIECRVLRTRSGESKRCGFVRFEKETDALDAIVHLNSKVLPGEKTRLRVKIADRERYQHLKKQKEVIANESA